jgi:hypothetical protein
MLIDVTGAVLAFVRLHTERTGLFVVVTSMAAPMDVSNVFTALSAVVIVANAGRRVLVTSGTPVAGQYSRPRPEPPGVALRRLETSAVWNGCVPLDVPGATIALRASAWAARVPSHLRASTRAPAQLVDVDHC